MPNWKIFYDDGKHFSGGCPWEAPGLGVLIIVEKDPECGRRLVSGYDFYIWRDQQWYGVDYFGLIDYLIQPGEKKVLLGRTVTNERYNEVYHQAIADPDFQPKTSSAIFEKGLR